MVGMPEAATAMDVAEGASARAGSGTSAAPDGSLVAASSLRLKRPSFYNPTTGHRAWKVRALATLESHTSHHSSSERSEGKRLRPARAERAKRATSAAARTHGSPRQRHEAQGSV
eukprot:5921499-Pleurochrysis_carterae.AAC.1